MRMFAVVVMVIGIIIGAFGKESSKMDLKSKPTVLLNVFTLKPEQEQEFMRRWNQVADYMRRRPGFISARMHREIGGGGKWFNYAEWASPQAFSAAVSTDDFKRLTKDFPGEGSPVLFEVVENVAPSEAVRKADGTGH